MVIAKRFPRVAPLAGAWIEICSDSERGTKVSVAPLAGAWIEIAYDHERYAGRSSRSPCGSVD